MIQAVLETHIKRSHYVLGASADMYTASVKGKLPWISTLFDTKCAKYTMIIILFLNQERSFPAPCPPLQQ